jgi:DNA-binding NtrC family response regulator
VRLIAATAQNLDDALRDGRFRLDLYHRLLVLGFTIPPLRERGDDAVLLAAHFLERHRRRYNRPALTFSTGAEQRIRTHPWPGNVRQLANAVEAAVLATDNSVVRARHLPLRTGFAGAVPDPASRDHHGETTSDATAGPPGTTKRRYSFYGSPAEERRLILDVLRRCHGNKTLAAATLGMTRNTLRSRLRTLHAAAAHGARNEAGGAGGGDVADPPDLA